MKLQKKLILGFLICLILLSAILTILISYGGDNKRLKKSLDYFSELIEQGKLNDLNLTIYYVNLDTLYAIPLSVEQVIYGGHKVIVSGSSLEEHITLLNQISYDALIPVEHETDIDARIYYVFKTKNNRKIFDVTMWGRNNSMYVNGIEVKENDIFYNVIIPFLPEDVEQKYWWGTNKGKLE